MSVGGELNLHVHRTKPSQVLPHYYEIIGGLRLPSLCCRKMLHNASDPYQSGLRHPENKMQSIQLKQKVVALEREPRIKGEGGEKGWNFASLEIWSRWVEKGLIGSVPDFDRCCSGYNISCRRSHLSKPDIHTWITTRPKDGMFPLTRAPLENATVGIVPQTDSLLNQHCCLLTSTCAFSLIGPLLYESSLIPLKFFLVLFGNYSA